MNFEGGGVDLIYWGGGTGVNDNYNLNVFNVILYYNHYIDLLHLSCNIIFEGGV